MSGGAPGKIVRSESMALLTGPGTLLDTIKLDRIRCAVTVGSHLWFGTHDGLMAVMDLPTGSIVRELPKLRIQVSSMDFHNGHVWVGFEQGTIRVYDAENGSTVSILQQHEGAVNAITHSADHVFSASDDGTMIQWDADADGMFAVRTLEGHDGAVNCMFMKGSLLFSGSDDHTIRIWRQETGEQIAELCEHTGPVTSLVVTEKDIWSASLDRRVLVWDLDEVRVVEEFHETGTILCLAIVGGEVWGGSEDRTIRIWDRVAVKEKTVLKKHAGPVTCVLPMYKVEHQVWSMSEDTTMRVWLAEAGFASSDCALSEQVLNELDLQALDRFNITLPDTDELERARVEIAELVKQKEDVEGELEELMASNDELMMEKEDAEARALELEDKLAIAMDELRKPADERTPVEGLSELEEAAGHSAMADELRKCKEELEQATLDLEDLRAEVDVLNELLTDKDEEKKEMERLLQEQDNKVMDLTFEMGVLEEEKHDLEAQVDKLQSGGGSDLTHGDLEELVRMSKELERELQRAKRTIASQQDEFEYLQDELSLYKEDRARDLMSYNAQYGDECEAPDAGDGSRDVTIVFTDVWMSHALWKWDPKVTGLSLGMHNDIVRKALREHRGYEVKTEGDAFMLAFASAEDAVRFAVRVHERMNEADWPVALLNHQYGAEQEGDHGGIAHRGLRVRMGMHAGPCVMEFEESTARADYYGGAVDVAARVAGQAEPGQCVATASLFESVRDAVERMPECRFEDLGEQDVRGGDAPVHLFALSASKHGHRRSLSLDQAAGNNRASRRISMRFDKLRKLEEQLEKNTAESSQNVTKLGNLKRQASEAFLASKSMVNIAGAGVFASMGAGHLLGAGGKPGERDQSMQLAIERNKVKLLEEKQEELEAELDKYVSDYDTMSRKLLAAEEKFARMTATDSSSLRAQVEDLRQQLDKADADLKTERRVMNRKLQEKEELVEKLQRGVATGTAAGGDNEELELVQEEMERELEDLVDRRDLFLEDVGEAGEDVDALLDVVDDVKDLILAAEMQQTWLRERVEAEAKKVDTLRRAIREQSEEHERDTGRMMEERLLVEEQIAKMEHHYVEFMNKVGAQGDDRNLEEEVQLLEQECEDLEDRLEELEEMRREERHELEDELDEIAAHEAELEFELKRARMENDQLRSRMEDVEEMVARLRESDGTGAGAGAGSGAGSGGGDEEELNRLHEEHAEEINELKMQHLEEMEELNQKLQKARTEADRSRSEVKDMTESTRNLKSNLKKLKLSGGTSSRALIQDSIESSRVQLQFVADKARTAAEEAEEMKARVEEQIAEVRGTVEEVARVRAEAEQGNGDLSQLRAALQSTQDLLSQQNVENMALAADLQKLISRASAGTSVAELMMSSNASENAKIVMQTRAMVENMSRLQEAIQSKVEEALAAQAFITKRLDDIVSDANNPLMTPRGAGAHPDKRLLKEIKQLRQQIEQLQFTNNQLNSKAESWKKSKEEEEKENIRRKAQLSTKEEEIAKLKKERVVLESKLREAGKSAEQLRGRVKELETSATASGGGGGGGGGTGDDDDGAYEAAAAAVAEEVEREEAKHKRERDRVVADVRDAQRRLREVTLRLSKLDKMTEKMGTDMGKDTLIQSTGYSEECMPPTGNVAVVSVVLASSAVLWQWNAGVVAHSLHLARDVLRKQARVFGGYEVRFLGDSCLLAFDDTRKAVEFCGDTQEKLMAVRWPKELLGRDDGGEVKGGDGQTVYRGLRVSMGVHCGDPTFRSDPTTRRVLYAGDVVTLAERLARMANGGQVLLSTDAYTRVRSALGDATVRDLGEQTMKGLGSGSGSGGGGGKGALRTVHVYGVQTPVTARRSFAPLQTDPQFADRVVEVQYLIEKEAEVATMLAKRLAELEDQLATNKTAIRKMKVQVEGKHCRDAVLVTRAREEMVLLRRTHEELTVNVADLKVRASTSKGMLTSLQPEVERLDQFSAKVGELSEKLTKSEIDKQKLTGRLKQTRIEFDTKYKRAQEYTRKLKADNKLLKKQLKAKA